MAGKKELWGDSIANTMDFLLSTYSCVSAETTAGMHIWAHAIDDLWLAARDVPLHTLFRPAHLACCLVLVAEVKRDCGLHSPKAGI